MPSPVCCQNALAMLQCALSNSKICNSMQSMTTLLELAVGVSGVAGVSGRDDADGQMTNSTIRDARGVACEARKSRAATATLGDGRRMHSSSGWPNFFKHSAASCCQAMLLEEDAPDDVPFGWSGG